MPSKLAPVGATVKYSERWHQRKRDIRGSGWSSNAEREQFKRWEKEDRERRWIVVEHVQPGTEHNACLDGPIYKLLEQAGGGYTYTLPYEYEEVPS